MTSRGLKIGGVAGSLAVVVGITDPGTSALTALIAGLLAILGSFEPLVSELISVSADSIPVAGFASDGLSIVPVLEILPTPAIDIVLGLTAGVAIALLIKRVRDTNASA